MNIRRLQLAESQNVSGFTLVELIIAMLSAVLIGASILISVVSLQKVFVAAQYHSMAQVSQARLLGYVERDLRCLTGTSKILSPTITTGSFTRIGSTSGTLTLVIPGFYSTGTSTYATSSGGVGNPTNTLIYPTPMSTSGTMNYGSSGSGAITSGTVQYFKAFQGRYNSQCYLRVESEGGVSNTTTIVEKADGLLLDIMRSGTGTPAAYILRVRFNPMFSYSDNGTQNEPQATASTTLTTTTDVAMTDYVVLSGTN